MNPPRFIIRFRGDYAVLFHNLRGPVFSLVNDSRASQFSDPAKAIETAIAHGIKPADAALRIADQEPANQQAA